MNSSMENPTITHQKSNLMPARLNILRNTNDSYTLFGVYKLFRGASVAWAGVIYLQGWEDLSDDGGEAKIFNGLKAKGWTKGWE